MREMEVKTDAFAALKGTLKNGPDAVLKAYLAFDEIGKLQYRLYRYPQLQRDVDTRDQAVAGRFQRVGALFSKFETATAWFSPELLTVPQPTMQRWIEQTPALTPYRFPILEVYRREAHVLDEKGERLLSLAGRFNDSPREAYAGTEHVGHQVPDRHAGRRPERHAVAGQLLRAARGQPQPGRPRQSGGGPRRHLRDDGSYLRRAVQQRAAARLVHCTSAQLPDHARRRAAQRRGAAAGRRDAGRRHARRRRAAAALPAAAQEAAQPRRPTIRTMARCRSSRATRPIPMPPPAS